MKVKQENEELRKALKKCKEVLYDFTWNGKEKSLETIREKISMLYIYLKRFKT